MLVGDVVSVKYFTVTKDNYDQALRYARQLLSQYYRYMSDLLRLPAGNGILMFAKPVVGGIERIKFDGDRDLLWKMLHDLRKGENA